MMMTKTTMRTRRGKRVSKSASWGKRVAKRAASTIMTMITKTRTTRRGERVARSGGTTMMTSPLSWAGVAHCHHLMK